jgi:putative phosphoesterase
MIVAIVSDSHDRAEPLARAVAQAKSEGARAVIHCGDVIGAQTLRPLLKMALPVHVVHGNNLGDFLAMGRLCAASGDLVTYHGQDAELVLGGRRLFVTHYPRYARAFACTGHFDVACCGHDHRAYVERVANVTGGHTLLVNPGSVAGLGGPATWILADLEALRFEIRELGKDEAPASTGAASIAARE